ncbi:MAG TPA: hypothetical protein VIP29_02060 [Nitrososphaeraceae archaeon]
MEFFGVMTFRTFFQVTSLVHISYISDNKYRHYQKHAYPLYGPDTELQLQTEIPLYAEEIIISQRKVMVGKVLIRKRQVPRNTP